MASTYSTPVTVSPRWYTAQVTASTSFGFGSRPSAFHRKPRLRAVLAADSTVFFGRSATRSSSFGWASSTIWPRLAHSLAAPSTALAHSGCSLAPRWSVFISAIFNLRGASPQRLHERALRRRRHVGIARLGARRAIEHESRVAHAAAHHMPDRQPAPALARVGRERHARPRRLETEQPALRRRDADRAAAVGGVRHRQHAGDDRRRGPARRAAGRMLEVPRVAAGPVQARLRVGVQPELRRRAAAHDHEPAFLQRAT